MTKVSHDRFRFPLRETEEALRNAIRETPTVFFYRPCCRQVCDVQAQETDLGAHGEDVQLLGGGKRKGVCLTLASGTLFV